MAEKDFVLIREVFLKADRETSRTVILKETREADASLIMIVGEAEFLALAKEKKMIQTPRPLTHDLYLDLLAGTEIDFLRVEIHDLREQAYLAAVIYQHQGTEKTVDARPSDAIALALHHRLPIWVNKKLLRRELTAEQREAFQDLIRSVKF
ncbi:MAG: bifunctional nuclease family protein [Thermodesulfobacteriota bacterium]